MGFVSLPRVASYWSTQWPLSSESIRKVLSRDHFQLISKFLHLSDNSTYVTRGQDGHDRLYKIHPLIVTKNEKIALMVKLSLIQNTRKNAINMTMAKKIFLHI